MEFDREQIIKAFECCYTLSSDCLSCPFLEDSKACTSVSLMALALIKELVEENEKLKSQNEEFCDELTCLKIELDMVARNVAKKMFDVFEKRLDISVVGYSTDEVVSDVLTTLNNVVKEVLED